MYRRTRSTSYKSTASSLTWGETPFKRSKRSYNGPVNDDNESEADEVGAGADILKGLIVGGMLGGNDTTNGLFNRGDETVTRHRNHIYFWDHVTPETALKFSRLVREVDEEQQVKLVKGELTEPVVYLHLNTPGGHLHEGFSMASVVESCKSRTVAIVEGMVASAGTLPLVCADERHMQQYSSVLIHQLRGGMWGTYEENEDEMKNQRQAMDTLRKIYREHTNMPRKELNSILKRELELNGETCIKYGIIHKLI